MTACEVCWERAQRDVARLGGYVHDHYVRHIDNDKDHERVPLRSSIEERARTVGEAWRQ